MPQDPIFAKFDQVLGKTTPTAVGATQSRADQIRALGKASVSTPPPTDTLGTETAKETLAGAQKMGSAISEGAQKFAATPQIKAGEGMPVGEAVKAEAQKTGALLETGLGAAAGATRSILAPLTAIIQKATQTAGEKTGLHPLDAIANSPVGQKLDEWSKAHPEAAKNLTDALTVVGGAMGDVGVKNPLNIDLGAMVKNAPETFGGAAKALEEAQGYGVKPPISEPGVAQDAAWKDIQPKATDKTIAAYRAQGATKSKGVLKGVSLTPSDADKKVLDVLSPLYQDGTLKPGMSTEEKLGVLENNTRTATAMTDKLVEANNKIVETPEVQSALTSAKEGSKVVFGSDKTLESAYSAPQESFIERLGAGKAGATGTDTVSLRDALKSWDAEMKSKFPNLWKSTATGELSATDNARLNGIMDTHTAIRDLIAEKLGKDVPYKEMLNKTSSLIKGAQMMNQNASNLSKVNSFINLVKNHPYFSGFAAWEALKHTVAPGLPGL